MELSHGLPNLDRLHFTNYFLLSHALPASLLRHLLINKHSGLASSVGLNRRQLAAPGLPAPAAAHPPFSRSGQAFIYFGGIRRWQDSDCRCQLQRFPPAPPSLSLLPDILSVHEEAAGGNVLLFFPRCHTNTKAIFQGDEFSRPVPRNGERWEVGLSITP